MTEYRIQELFDFDKCGKYFVIQKKYKGREWVLADTPRYDNLKVAKAMVKIMKEYETPKYHYLEEEEN